MSDKLLKEVILIRKILEKILKGHDRFGEFVLELSPSEAKEEIKDLKK